MRQYRPWPQAGAANEVERYPLLVMNPSDNPILLSLAKPLPHNAPTKTLIESGAPLRDIAGQAKVEWTCLATHAQNPLGKVWC